MIEWWWQLETVATPKGDDSFSPKGAGKAIKYIKYGPMNKGPLPDAIANTFRSDTYSQVVTQEEVILYRAYGGKAGELGGYWTRTEPQGPLQTVIDSALDQNWGNTATNVAKIKVPMGTTIYMKDLRRHWKHGKGVTTGHSQKNLDEEESTVQRIRTVKHKKGSSNILAYPTPKKPGILAENAPSGARGI